MATLKYKDSQGNYQPVIGYNVTYENEVVQTTGTSTTAVMSLKSVTDVITENEEVVSTALNDLNDRISSLPSTSEAAESGGTDLSLVTTGEKYNYEDKYTKTQIDALTRHTRLTDFDLNVLKQAVAEGNLEKYGLKPGDQKTINGYTYVIAGLNPMKGTATPYRLTVNHVGLIVIPHTTLAWNASGNTYTGANNRGAGYANCDLHYYLKTTTLPHVQNDLGSANLLAHSKLLSTAVNTSGYNKVGSASGCSSSWAWQENQYISALSEVLVYGGTVWSSSSYDTGEACRQLEVFQHYSHPEIFGDEYTWLRDVASASSAAFADYGGSAGGSPASSALYVAGLILFH